MGHVPGEAALVQILVQRPAIGNVHDLQTAAYPQGRDVTRECRPGQGELEIITQRRRRLEVRRDALPVRPGMDVGTADEQEPVDPVEEDAGIMCRRRVRYEADRDASRSLYLLDVISRQDGCWLGPASPARRLEGGADPD